MFLILCLCLKNSLIVTTQSNNSLLIGVPIPGKSTLYCPVTVQQCYTNCCSCAWDFNHFFFTTQCNSDVHKGVPEPGKSTLYSHDMPVTVHLCYSRLIGHDAMMQILIVYRNQPYIVMTLRNSALLKGVPVTGKWTLYCHDTMQQCFTNGCSCDRKMNLIFSWHSGKVLY